MCVGRYAAKVMRNERSEMPAYTHQIPNGISSHRFRDNMYIISKKNWTNVWPKKSEHG